jgi:hypothetical protein
MLLVVWFGFGCVESESEEEMEEKEEKKAVEVLQLIQHFSKVQ